EDLKPKPEYVVTTSEFNDVKARLLAMHNRRKVEDKDIDKPTLRRAPGAGTIEDNGDGTKSKGDDDERPTLKRRPDSQ
ncbi:MAG: M48 family metallopeptidase, partial [Bryobacteraceae bacterium]